MPKQTFLSRYSLIIKRLEKGPATFDEIERFLEKESEYQDKQFSISKRTFQRDIKDIYEQLNFEIVNERKGDKRYFIRERPEEKQHSLRLLESYEIINAINATQQYTNCVFWESRKPRGLEHFSGLLYAIQNKKITKFEHYKYWDETITHRTVHPLALKESQGRWYLLAVDTKDAQLKTFGLDRISGLEILKTSFKEKYGYDISEIFNNHFGIINDTSKPVEKVLLQFESEQGQYVKSYPLHTSQIVKGENKKQVIIELTIAITYDFIMEILRLGNEVKVLQPLSLIKQIKTMHKKAFEQYN